MSRHVCLKEWINGNEISVSIDDNLCSKFRAEVIIFHDENMKNTKIGSCYNIIRLGELIIEAVNTAKDKKGTCKEFCSRVLLNQESLEVAE